jgi:hypothetical protein
VRKTPYINFSININRHARSLLRPVSLLEYHSLVTSRQAKITGSSELNLKIIQYQVVYYLFNRLAGSAAKGVENQSDAIYIGQYFLTRNMADVLQRFSSRQQVNLPGHFWIGCHNFVSYLPRISICHGEASWKSRWLDSYDDIRWRGMQWLPRIWSIILSILLL